MFNEIKISSRSFNNYDTWYPFPALNLWLYICFIVRQVYCHKKTLRIKEVNV